jgi:hypothetical protein
MAQRPNRHLEYFRASTSLDPGEKYIGAFLARTPVKLLWFFVMGPLAVFTMRQYQIVVTDRRIFFLRLSMLGKPAGVDAFSFGEVRDVSFKKGVMTYKMVFRFHNGRTVRLDSNYKALVQMEGFLFDDALKAYLERAIA